MSVISTSRPVDFLLDEGHAAWQLVRLLGQRNEAGDIEQARIIATEALTRLEPTKLVRRKRMINEALADLPNATNDCLFDIPSLAQASNAPGVRYGFPIRTPDVASVAVRLGIAIRGASTSEPLRAYSYFGTLSV